MPLFCFPPSDKTLIGAHYTICFNYRRYWFSFWNFDISVSNEYSVDELSLFKYFGPKKELKDELIHTNASSSDLFHHKMRMFWLCDRTPHFSHLGYSETMWKVVERLKLKRKNIYQYKNREQLGPKWLSRQYCCNAICE